MDKSAERLVSFLNEVGVASFVPAGFWLWKDDVRPLKEQGTSDG